MARLAEFRLAGITAATISRLEREGTIIRRARGLYQLADAAVETHHTIAEASKLVPKGIICLNSALAFHDLTDQISSSIWIAIGQKAWRPKLQYPPLHFARFPAAQLKVVLNTT